MSKRKDLVLYNRITQFQTEWSIDELVTTLKKYGIDISLRVTRTKDNEVTVSLSATNEKRVRQKLDTLLFKLYGIMPND